MFGRRRLVIVGGLLLLVALAVIGLGARPRDQGDVGQQAGAQLLQAGSQLAVLSIVAHNPVHATVTSVPVGTSVHVRAAVVGAFGTVTGTVTSRVYSNGTCSGFIEGQSSATALSGGVADVTGFTWSTNDSGAISFIVHYNGNATYAARDSACLKVTETRIAPVVALRVHDPNHVVKTEFPLGINVHPWVGVTGDLDPPTGSVRASWWQDGNCFGDPIITSNTQALVGVVADLTTFVRPSSVLGSYSFRADYLGDTTYAPRTGPCVEYLVVKATPTVHLTIHDATHEPVAYVAVGQFAHAAVTISGSAGAPTGNVEIWKYDTSNCVGTPAKQTVAGAASLDPAGTAIARLDPGYISWSIHFLGDAKYVAKNSTCMFMRWKSQPHLFTAVHDATHHEVTAVAPGTAVHLRVATSPDASNTVVTGKVAVYLYAGGTCPGNGGVNKGTGTLVSGVLDDTAITAAPTIPGTYQLEPVYQGDATYAPVVGPCTTFTVVNPASPTPKPSLTPTKGPTPSPTKVPAPAPTTAATSAPATPAASAGPGATSGSGPSGVPAAASPNPSAGPSAVETAGESGQSGGTQPGASAVAGPSGAAATQGGSGEPVPAVAEVGGSLLLIVAALVLVALVIGFVAWRARRPQAS